MFSTKNLFVISDIHLTPECGAGLFQADDELATFLDWVAKSGPGTLVLNGDILDFLSLEPGFQFQGKIQTEQALKANVIVPRAKAIIDAHPKVFTALRSVVSTPDLQLVWLGGNHDPEFIYPEVRQVIETELGSSAIRWLTYGEAAFFRVGDARIVVEHGNQLDRFNHINYEALRRETVFTTRGIPTDSGYKPPAGSRVVIELLPKLRADYPWVEYLKPETETVVPLLFELLSMKKLLSLPDLTLLRSWLNVERDKIFVNLWQRTVPGSQFWAADDAADPFEKWLSSLESELESYWGGPEQQQPEVVSRKVIDRLKKVATESNFFKVHLSDKSAKSSDKSVEWLLKQNVDLVIHGHTHAAKAYALGTGLYLNSGTWAMLMKLPESKDDEKWRTFLKSLMKDAAEPAQPFKRPTYVQVRLQENGTVTAGLHQWGVADPLAVRRFDATPKSKESQKWI